MAGVNQDQEQLQAEDEGEVVLERIFKASNLEQLLNICAADPSSYQAKINADTELKLEQQPKEIPIEEYANFYSIDDSSAESLSNFHLVYDLKFSTSAIGLNLARTPLLDFPSGTIQFSSSAKGSPNSTDFLTKTKSSGSQSNSYQKEAAEIYVDSFATGDYPAKKIGMILPGDVIVSAAVKGQWIRHVDSSKELIQFLRTCGRPVYLRLRRRPRLVSLEEVLQNEDNMLRYLLTYLQDQYEKRMASQYGMERDIRSSSSRTSLSSVASLNRTESTASIGFQRKLKESYLKSVTKAKRRLMSLRRRKKDALHASTSSVLVNDINEKSNNNVEETLSTDTEETEQEETETGSEHEVSPQKADRGRYVKPSSLATTQSPKPSGMNRDTSQREGEIESESEISIPQRGNYDQNVFNEDDTKPHHEQGEDDVAQGEDEADEDEEGGDDSGFVHRQTPQAHVVFLLEAMHVKKQLADAKTVPEIHSMTKNLVRKYLTPLSKFSVTDLFQPEKSGIGLDVSVSVSRSHQAEHHNKTSTTSSSTTAAKTNGTESSTLNELPQTRLKKTGKRLSNGAILALESWTTFLEKYDIAADTEDDNLHQVEQSGMHQDLDSSTQSPQEMMEVAEEAFRAAELLSPLCKRAKKSLELHVFPRFLLSNYGKVMIKEAGLNKKIDRYLGRKVASFIPVDTLLSSRPSANMLLLFLANRGKYLVTSAVSLYIEVRFGIYSNIQINDPTSTMCISKTETKCDDEAKILKTLGNKMSAIRSRYVRVFETSALARVRDLWSQLETLVDTTVMNTNDMSRTVEALSKTNYLETLLAIVNELYTVCCLLLAESPETSTESYYNIFLRTQSASVLHQCVNDAVLKHSSSKDKDLFRCLPRMSKIINMAELREGLVAHRVHEDISHLRVRDKNNETRHLIDQVIVFAAMKPTSDQPMNVNLEMVEILGGVNFCHDENETDHENEESTLRNAIPRHIEKFFLPAGVQIIKASEESGDSGKPRPYAFNFLLSSSGGSEVQGVSMVTYYEIVREEKGETETYYVPVGVALLSRIVENGILVTVGETLRTVISKYAKERSCVTNKCNWHPALELNDEVSLLRKLSSESNELFAKMFMNNIDQEFEINAKNEMISYQHLASLFECLSVEKVLKVFECCILERKLLFVCSRYSMLVQIMQALREMIMPLTWCHVYAPVLPRTMLDHLMCPTPFMIGIHKNFAFKHDFPFVVDVTIVDLDEGTVQTPDPNASINSLPGSLKVWLHNSLRTVLKTRLMKSDDVLLFEEAHNPVNNESGATLRNVLGFPGEKVLDVFREAVEGRILRNIDEFCTPLFHGNEAVMLFDEEAYMHHRGSDERTFLESFQQTQAFSNFLSRKVKE